MALLKNAERRSIANGNTGVWPNVSSINGDHLDTSLTAMSIQSSRIGSEVVSSSTNLRNILLHKQHFNGPRNTAATSSENQFPTNKDNDDSAMMPPPTTPGISFGRTKRFSGENQRMPLLNMPMNSGRDNNGFSVSTPASSISSIAKCTESIRINSSTTSQENNNYHERNVYGDAVSGTSQKQERHFSRWRVLLNDEGQLIIKGTLDCGKVARSKPVIRRLTSTSVQSIFKHIYHLHGNLVDYRDELPDYVRGKFYNGFPDDWQNVYQVWRNFVNEGHRLSFRWPTAITDSDDDIKSGITEISYRPERCKKTVSPRKRKRLLRTSKLDLSVENNENRPEPNACSSSQNASGGTPSVRSVRDGHPPSENLQQSHSKTNSFKDPCKADATSNEKQKSSECSAASLNITDRSSVNSLAGYIPEDKLNIIVDNLSNKNCPIEYINKIVEMFECMKYVVSYQSSAENESEKGSSVTPEMKASRTPTKGNRSTDEKCDDANKSSSKNSINTLHSSITKVKNQLPPGSTGSVTNEKSYKDHGCQTRRQLTEYDYESSESDNDSYDASRRTSTERFFVSNERLGKVQKYQIPLNSVVSRSNREYVEPEKSFEAPRRQYAEISDRRKQKHDSSISDEEFVVERKRDSILRNNRASPRKVGGAGKANRGEAEYYDSSISITEDEERYTNKPKAKNIRKDNYDSSVSITEDERGDQNAWSRINNKKYYPEPNARSLDPEMRRNGNSRDDDEKRPEDLNYYTESKSRPLEQTVTRTGSIRGARKRLDSLNYNAESNSRQVDQDTSRNEDICDSRKRLDSVDYYSDSHSRPVEQDIIRSEDIPENRKRLDSLKIHTELNSLPNEQNMSEKTSLRNSRVPRKTPTFARPIAADDDDRDTANAPNPTLKVHGSSTRSNVNIANEQEDDSAYLPPDINGRNERSPEIKRSKKLNKSLETTEEELSKSCVDSRAKKTEFHWSPESPEMASPKSRTPQVKKKPAVINIEAVDVCLKVHDRRKLSGGKESERNAGNLPRNCVDGPNGNSPKVTKNSPISPKSPRNMSEATKAKTRSKEANCALKVQDGKSSMKENKTENVESPVNSANIAPVGGYGSEVNPKLLTAWVPAVICDTNGDQKCHLIFEGKLINEAGHVTDRKFVTGSVRRRLSPKIIETFSHDFYKLVGDLNDTKHVVPKELIKLCHSGCPGRIGYFCERWKSLAGEILRTPPQERTHNTSVDCLSVPMSSRGRRILPPLNYWTGERVVIKDKKTMYSPGNSQESSIPSSLENTTLDVRNKKNSPKARSETKRTNEIRATESKKKDLEKISPPSASKSTKESPSQQARVTQKIRGGKRRLTKNVQISSSESDEGAETKTTSQKRKTRVNDKTQNTENVSAKKLRNSSKNSASPQKLVQVSISPQKDSIEKPSDPEVKRKFRKRQKIDDNQATLQQFVTRRPAEIKCMYYKNVPMHDGDLSEDQLSTM